MLTSMLHTAISSPSLEEHIMQSGNELTFEGEHLKPLTEVSFKRENSGKDLQWLVFKLICVQQITNTHSKCDGGIL